MCWVLPDFGYGFTLASASMLIQINAWTAAAAFKPPKNAPFYGAVQKCKKRPKALCVGMMA